MSLFTSWSRPPTPVTSSYKTLSLDRREEGGFLRPGDTGYASVGLLFPWLAPGGETAQPHVCQLSPLIPLVHCVTNWRAVTFHAWFLTAEHLSVSFLFVPGGVGFRYQRWASGLR